MNNIKLTVFFLRSGICGFITKNIMFSALGSNIWSSQYDLKRQRGLSQNCLFLQKQRNISVANIN